MTQAHDPGAEVTYATTNTIDDRRSSHGLVLRVLSGGVHPVLLAVALSLGLGQRIGAADLLVRGATLIDGTGSGPRPRTDVLVRGGRVAAVGTDLAAGGAPTLDADGPFLIPGLIDAQVYVAAGVTTVRDCGSAPEIARDLRGWLADGHAGARLLVLAPTLGAPDGSLSDVVPPVRRPDEVAERLVAAESVAPSGVK